MKAQDDGDGFCQKFCESGGPIDEAWGIRQPMGAAGLVGRPRRPGVRPADAGPRACPMTGEESGGPRRAQDGGTSYCFQIILGKFLGMIPKPSLTVMMRSGARSVNLSTMPLGQAISRESMRVRSPRPKWMRGSWEDM